MTVRTAEELRFFSIIPQLAEIAGHLLTCGEDGINANSIGRLDQILYPYYQADIDADRITREAGGFRSPGPRHRPHQTSEMMRDGSVPASAP